LPPTITRSTAGLTTAAEDSQFYKTLLSNPAHFCSFSPFNTYFVLQSVGKLKLPGGRTEAMRAVCATHCLVVFLSAFRLHFHLHLHWFDLVVVAIDDVATRVSASTTMTCLF
jgi:hypothetical protein